MAFPGSWETGTGFSQPRVHTVMVGRVPVGHKFLPITVWTSGWENQFQFPNFLEEAFSDITVISKKIAHFENVLNFTTRRFIFPIRKTNLLVVYHREIYFPYWENESPGGELWLVDDYHQEIHFPNKESKSPGGILWLKITDFSSMRGLLL